MSSSSASASPTGTGSSGPWGWRLGDTGAGARLQELWGRGTSGPWDGRRSAVVVGGALLAAAGLGGTLWMLRRRKQGYRYKPMALELSGGSLANGHVKSEWQAYEASYANGRIVETNQTTQLVDVFYSLVTDLYEWGWGQSFHFSPKLPGKDWRASEAAHEARVAALLDLKPGKVCLDAGCGVGGPMRTITAASGARVVGVTINQYQVDRCKKHNAQVGVTDLTTVKRANFLELPFDNDSFDGAYAIEATCHAAKLEEAYAEIFRILKPGARFLSYEWVSTKVFDAKNPEHQKIIDEINFGNGLPEMRTWDEAEKSGKKVGFNLVESIDLAVSSSVNGPWYDRLGKFTYMHRFNHRVVCVLDFLHLAPKGLKQVHNMLVNVAVSLVRGGETGVFTPMHMLVFEKPANPAN